MAFREKIFQCLSLSLSLSQCMWLLRTFPQEDSADKVSIFHHLPRQENTRAPRVKERKKRKKERKKTERPNEGWDEDRVPTCTSRILEERSGALCLRSNSLSGAFLPPQVFCARLAPSGCPPSGRKTQAALPAAGACRTPHPCARAHSPQPAVKIRTPHPAPACARSETSRRA